MASYRPASSKFVGPTPRDRNGSASIVGLSTAAKRSFSGVTAVPVLWCCWWWLCPSRTSHPGSTGRQTADSRFILQWSRRRLTHRGRAGRQKLTRRYYKIFPTSTNTHRDRYLLYRCCWRDETLFDGRTGHHFPLLLQQARGPLDGLNIKPSRVKPQPQVWWCNGTVCWRRSRHDPPSSSLCSIVVSRQPWWSKQS